MFHVFCLMGKSASGKDTIYRMLLENKELKLKKAVPYTTRPIRKGEEEGREYFFRTFEDFDLARKEGRIIEYRKYDTVYGPWYYYTADDGQIDVENADTLIIGTLEAYTAIRDYFAIKTGNAQTAVPVYINVDDGDRLMRAIKREKKEAQPRYEEVCRRFIADQKDFSEENLEKAGIDRRFDNSSLDLCMENVEQYIRSFRTE